MKTGRIVVPPTALAIIFIFAPPLKSEESPSLLDTARRAGYGWVEDYVPASVLANFELPSEKDWERFGQSLQSVFETGSLEDFAWILPEVKSALAILDSVEGGAPYADWLRQRLDYLDLAAAVVEKPPPAGAPTPPLKRFRIMLPPRPAPFVVSPQTAKRRSEIISSVKVWEEKLSGRPVPTRARNFVPDLKEVFTLEGVPPELVWLAEVESSFNPNARSPGGARGLFQFMPATAKRFGLQLSPVDSRGHPRLSAAAAARYLKLLYGQFDSWPLALAAYNAGEGRVRRVLDGHGVKSFAAAAAHLPVETQMYVPKVLATVSLREGIDALTLPPPSSGPSG